MSALSIWFSMDDPWKPLPQNLTTFATDISCIVETVEAGDSEYVITASQSERAGTAAAPLPVGDRPFKFKTDTALSVGQRLIVDFLISSAGAALPTNVRLS